jgi:hypothetical protein
MSESKHTPWYWAGPGDLRGTGDLEVGDCLDRLSDTDEVPRFAADARLIAAAPDLLAACEAVLACPPRDRHDLHLEEIVCAAVANARGA